MSRRRSLHTRSYRTRSRQAHILIRMRLATGIDPIRWRRTRSTRYHLRLIASAIPHATSPPRTHPMQCHRMPRRTPSRDCTPTHTTLSRRRNPVRSLSPRRSARTPTCSTRAHPMTLRSPSVPYRRRMARVRRTRLRQTTGTEHRCNQSNPQRNRTSNRKRISSPACAVLPLGEPPLRHHHHKF